jgi:methyltransferase (TIGR00027 family)
VNDSPINDVSDTAYWIAHHRADESERRDALFRDPLARRLAGERGARIAAGLPAQRFIAWNVAVRTCIIDDFVGAAIAQGADTVLNLGAGLDSRPYRMALPAGLRWVEADHPHIVADKTQQLEGETPHCRLERISIDLADMDARRRMLAEVNAGAARLLVLTEGLLPYLSEDEASVLAQDLRALEHARWWIVDYVSPQAMEYRRRGGMADKMRNAPFKFEPGDWMGFFRSRGWNCAEMRYMPAEGERLGRPFPVPALLRWMMRFASEPKKKAFREVMGYAVMEPC